ncbi:hypothetical protein THAOC_04648 [Thalassiosira oceanica]|uniref:Uncharacterized protein n=1 Tax=Thalassiosira oceanica TaxID=159749 RepID=K0TIV1_THAOC|nr:hypothetical protein THAOC_04648 [Thalassiosira oceanica]|eukprot:EJK73711.1 hypothetical protein THAOC_04648 [Thalassiosira oceanica]
MCVGGSLPGLLQLGVMGMTLAAPPTGPSSTSSSLLRTRFRSHHHYLDGATVRAAEARAAAAVPSPRRASTSSTSRSRPAPSAGRPSSSSSTVSSDEQRPSRIPRGGTGFRPRAGLSSPPLVRPRDVPVGGDPVRTRPDVERDELAQHEAQAGAEGDLPGMRARRSYASLDLLSTERSLTEVRLCNHAIAQSSLDGDRTAVAFSPQATLALYAALAHPTGLLPALAAKRPVFRRQTRNPPPEDAGHPLALPGSELPTTQRARGRFDVPRLSRDRAAAGAPSAGMAATVPDRAGPDSTGPTSFIPLSSSQRRA